MASLFSRLQGTRKPALRLLGALLACAFLGMGSKPAITVRFHTEANERDTDKFSQPVTFRHPPRQAFISRIAAIHEKQIKAIYPFQASDGTWGCAFQLDVQGRLALEVISTQQRGSTVVVFVATKAGTHQAAEMLIDKPILDGIVSIPNGLTELEIGALTKAFPVIGQKKKGKLF